MNREAKTVERKNRDPNRPVTNILTYVQMESQNSERKKWLELVEVY